MSEDDQVRTSISHFYGDDKERRAEARDALVKCGKRAVLPLIEILDDNDWIVRYRAAEALGLIGDERAINPLTQKLRDEKDHVRYMAVKGLGFFNKKELSVSLIPMLRDENEFVRKISAVSLGKIGEKTAYSSLVKAAESESDERAREAMSDAANKIYQKLNR